MEVSEVKQSPSELIKNFVLARRQLSEVQHAHRGTHMALHKHCLDIMNEIFDELRTTHNKEVIRHCEWNIIDIDEYLTKIIIIVRFATKKDEQKIQPMVRLQLISLYQEALQKATTRFLSYNTAFIIRPIFA